MSQELNPREVLFYLNELGYTNISAQQLKEFMIDLKKLLKQKETNKENVTNDYPCQIKYNKQYINEHERSQNFRNNHNKNEESYKQTHHYGKNDKYNKYSHEETEKSHKVSCKSYDGEDEESCDSPRSESSDSDDEQLQIIPTRDVFNELYNTDTISSRAKSVKRKKKERVITVQINRPKCFVKTNTEVGTDTVDLVPPLKIGSQCRDSPTASAVTDLPKCTTSSTVRTTDSGATVKKGSSGEKKEKMRPKTSFIRPRLNTKPPRSDPVALYHQYQEEWKKHKIPGTENHSQVRWCIREKLLGDKFDYCY